LTLPAAKGDVARPGVVNAHLIRGQNRLVWTLERAKALVDTGTLA
jgi:hypothetical protein